MFVTLSHLVHYTSNRHERRKVCYTRCDEKLEYIRYLNVVDNNRAFS